MCTWLEPFRSCFTGPTFRYVLVLVTGAILTPARRTITATLSVVGLSQAPTFTNYHRVLNRNRWCSREVARRLLRLLVTAFMPAGPLIIALDDTLERRWGARIKARGIYRDPVRSSQGHFVKASGLRWLSFMLLTPVPWADRVWALPFLIPFLTVLAPSERYAMRVSADDDTRPSRIGRTKRYFKLLAGSRSAASSPSRTAASPPSRCCGPCANASA
jgi:hypothetical protein